MVYTLFWINHNIYSQICIENKTIESGLNQMQVNSVFFDNNGLLWVGTRGGLMTYNNRSFDDLEGYENIPQYIIDINQLSTGNIICISNTDLFYLEGTDFIAYDIKPEWRQHIYSRLFVDWEDRTWLQRSQNNEIFYFKDGCFTSLLDLYPFLSKYKVCNLVPSNSQKCYYLITKTNEILKFDPFNNRIEIIHKHKTFPRLLHTMSKSIIGQGMLFKDWDSNDSLQYYLDFNQAQIDTIHSIDNTVVGNITHDMELPLKINDGLGLIKNEVYTVIVESFINEFNHFLSYARHENIHYIGTDRGLIIATEHPFLIFDEKEYPFVWFVNEDNDGQIVTGSFGNGIKYIGGHIVKYDSNCLLKHQSQLYFHPDKTLDGSLLIPHAKGVLKLKDKQLKQVYPTEDCGKQSDKLYIYQDTIENITVLGACPGVEFINNQYELVRRIEDLGFEHNCILTICKDLEQNYWFAGSNGIAKYDYALDSLTTYNKLDGLIRINGAVCSLLDSDGDIWFGAKNGLSRYDSELDSFINYPQLSDYSISSIIQYSEDKFFLGVIEGLLMIDLKKLKQENEIHSRLFSKKDGFDGLEVGQNGLYIDSKRYLWVTTMTNLISINPDELSYTIKDIKYYYKSVNDIRVHDTDTINLPKNENYINIVGQVYNYPNYKSVVCRFRIDEENWSKWDDNLNYQFTNLHNSVYTIDTEIKYKTQTDIQAVRKTIFVNTDIDIWRDPRLILWLAYITIIAMIGIVIALQRSTKLKGRIKASLERNEVLYDELETLEGELSQLRHINDILKQKRTQFLISSTEKVPLMIKSYGQEILIHQNDIEFITAEENGIRVTYNNTSCWSDISLKKFHELLPSQVFFKVRRNTIVNLLHIKAINNDKVEMKNGDVLQIGKTFKKKLKYMILDKTNGSFR